jgi:hypothetical protein
MAERSVHTVNKPVGGSISMIRDASAWGYSQPRTMTSGATSIPAAPMPVAAETVELPELPRPAEHPASGSLAWGDDVIYRTMGPISRTEPNAAARETPSVDQEPGPLKAVVKESRSVQTVSGRVSRTDAGAWVLRSDEGHEYLLNGDESVLRLRVGDRVEVSGPVIPPVPSRPTLSVEKISFSARR